MADRNRLLLDEAVAWHVRNSGRMLSQHVDGALIGPTTGQSKDSIILEFQSSGRISVVTIWDSGEYEIVTAQVDRDLDPTVKVALRGSW